MIGSLWIGRRGAPSKEGFDHVGDDGTRLGEVEGGDSRIHLVETLAAAQQFGIDRADLVEHLLQLAEVGEELGDLGISCIGHVAELRALAGSSDCGEISLGTVPGGRRRNGSWAGRSACKSPSTNRARSARPEAGRARVGGDACAGLRMLELASSSDRITSMSDRFRT